MQDLKKTANTLHSLERKVLPLLEKYKDIQDLAKNSGLQEIEVNRALQWMEAKGIVILKSYENKVVKLDKNGLKYVKTGLPESIFSKALGKKAMSLEDIKKNSGLSDEETNVCVGLLKRKAMLDTVEGKNVRFKLNDNGIKSIGQKSVEERFIERLKIRDLELGKLTPEDKFAYDNLIRRKDIIKIHDEKIKTFELTDFGRELIKIKIDTNIIESLTHEIIVSDEWKKRNFRAYDIKANVPKITGGRFHPLQETINQVRRIFMDMGFKEMEGPLVETAFWCMDSMWIPQDHPARDVQDTFFLPYEGNIPEQLAKKVSIEHENGGNSGSKGYGYKWNQKIAKQLLLRTHTTATTFRYFGEKKIKYPAKYFYIGRIFRNEAIDATHLPEFHQSEGFIMDEGLTLRDLMGYIKEFYSLMGIYKIKFKPTYNPYTEPSMECIGYNEQLGKWIELINSGIFRPESLEPYGIDVPVLGWGLGVERLAMMLHQQKDVRNMLGATGDLRWLRKHKVIAKW